MPLTRDFRETVMARVKSDPAFRSELIVEATNALKFPQPFEGVQLDGAPHASGLPPLIHKTGIRMKRKTNFDQYLEEQLKDNGFAERFRKAREAWDVALELAAVSLKVLGDGRGADEK